MFIPLTENILVAPQISVADIAAAKEQGVTMIINNRPDGESDDQPDSSAIEATARAAGMDYAAIPVTHSGFAQWQLDATDAALAAAGDGKILAFCRSGTRSTLLWALTRARAGDNCDKLSAIAGRAGYDLSPVRAMMDTFSAGR